MWCAALLAAVKFVVALPDYPAVFIVGMPYLRAVPALAVAAFYFAGKDAYAALAVRPRLPDSHLLLHRLEHGRVYDGVMVILHIILRDLALVDLFLFGKEIHRVHFLQERVPFVFFVREDAPDRASRPVCLAARSRDAFLCQHLCDCER